MIGDSGGDPSGANGSGGGTETRPTCDVDQARRDIAAGNVAPTADVVAIPAWPASAHAALHRKLRCPPSVAAAFHSGSVGELSAIVSVAEAGYVLAGTRLRMWIGPALLTAAVEVGALPDVLDDPLVVSVQVSAPPRRDAD